jgi:hypothetical protein
LKTSQSREFFIHAFGTANGCKLAEEQMLKIHVGDDHDSTGLVPRPSCQQALEAASTLSEYISDRDDAFARQLEASWPDLDVRRIWMT